MHPLKDNHKIIFRLSALGDLILTTGVIDFWAKKYGWTFSVITKQQYAAPLEKNPHITEIIKLDKNDLGDSAWISKAGELALKYEGCELIDLHSTLRSRILAMRWRGTVSRYKKFSLERRLFKLTRSSKLEKVLEDKPVTVRYTSAIEKKLPEAKKLLPHIYLTKSEKCNALSMMKRENLNKNFIALHPYATHPDKAWPREYWIELIRQLDEKGIQWAVVGKDENILNAGKSEWNFTNRLSLRQTSALLQEAKFLVTGDSGPMHLAAGVGTPVIAMFGPTSKVWGFYPAGKYDRILELDLNCRPCSLHGKSNCNKNRECLKNIHPEKIMNILLNPNTY
ncbi:glycosyltransferase family 9 protein [Maridesulfovibrio ferrireducens]|uniref:glycosyltransferase family 9 protein n=1 Tax=Maridesulfovibrio ferrireducens TaxID=246191 RepID=UPI001A2C9AA6|nr:glycosyltransferase family 9 protein [Maridesulfovibrio ferrireducens]MBI9111583.1 glycosyltransferase family 9 protein [Maridesulfovibrio ferrireducens]